MPTDLQSTLRAEAQRLADQLFETAMRLLSNHINEVFSPSTAPPPIAPLVEESPPAPAGAGPAQALEAIVETLGRYPDGLRRNGLRSVLKLDEATLSKAIHLGLTSKRLKKTGDRRTTTYLLPPSNGGSIGRVIRRKKE